MKHLARQRRRAVSSLVAVLLVPGMVAAIPAASAADPADDRTTIAPAEPLLDAPRHGRKAIRQLGDQLAVAAGRNDLRPAELRTLLRTDEAVWVDPEGFVYYVDPAPDSTPGAGETPASDQVVPLSDTFAMHSNPGASRTILLDFDGAHVSGTAWNVQSNVTPGDHPAWDPAADGPAFSDGERVTIQQVWAMVAEDYAPFDVDVTTEDPGEEGMVRSSSGDTVYGSRVLVTPSDDPFLKICNRGCGGVAYLSVFDRVGSYTQPAWVFPQALGNDPKNVAEAATHEAGHNLGLDHDGTSVQGYYGGHGVWAPIMGVGYDRPLAQWSRGSYTGANNQQDDLGVLTGYLGGRPDEASGSEDTPSILPDGEAVIGSPDDVDAYLLGTCAADTVVEVLPDAVAPNLDVRAVLYDADGTQRSVTQPASGFGDGTKASGLGGSLTVPGDGDGWVVTVEGVGEGAWGSNGYDDYGSLGAYTVSAPGCDGELAAGVPSAPGDLAANLAGTDSLTLAWAAPAVTGDGPVTGYIVSRSGSAATQTLGAAARSHTFTGLAAGTTYQLSVRAVNATGAGPSAMVTATTAEPAPATPSVPRDVTGSYDQQTGRLQAWWTEPADVGTQPVSGYAIYLDGDYLGQLGSSYRGVDITRDGGFSEGQYVVGVAAVSAVGLSPVAPVTITVDLPDRPAAPSGVSARSGDATAAVAWTAPDPNGSPITRYTVIARTPGADDRTTAVGGASTSATVTGLTNGTAYTFTVRATNAVGEGPESDASNAVTPRPQASAPSTMPPPRVVVRGSKAIVTWKAASPNGSRVTRYLVDIDKGKDKSVDGSARRAVLKRLKPGRYKIRVAARNARGTSAFSRWVKIRIR